MIKDEVINLRLSVAAKIDGWTNDGVGGYWQLANLLGYATPTEFIAAHDEGLDNINEKLLMLAGEHGYAVWKAMRAAK